MSIATKSSLTVFSSFFYMIDIVLWRSDPSELSPGLPPLCVYAPLLLEGVCAPKRRRNG